MTVVNDGAHKKALQMCLCVRERHLFISLNLNPSFYRSYLDPKREIKSQSVLFLKGTSCALFHSLVSVPACRFYTYMRVCLMTCVHR